MLDKPQLIERPEPSGKRRARRPRMCAGEPSVQLASAGADADAGTSAPTAGSRAAKPFHRGRALMAAGLACLVASAALMAYNAWQDNAAGQASTAAAAQMQAVISETPTSDDAAAAGSSVLDADEVVEIDGYSYLGVLRIPALGLELPVMAEWSGDYEALKVSPVRQFGSVVSGSLVIAGHNYTSHFGGLSHLVTGDEVTFTAVSGKVLRYEVESVETVAPESVDYVRSLEGLTLYTCTYGGQSRVVVHCRQAG